MLWALSTRAKQSNTSPRKVCCCVVCVCVCAYIKPSVPLSHSHAHHGCEGSLISSNIFKLSVSADYVKGFGGKFGVQTDRQDKSALGWDHQEKLQLHESQKGTALF